MPAPTNAEIAEVFLRMGDLMDYQAQDAFKIRSYWRAAEVLLRLPEPLAEIAARGALETVPGVGKAIAGKIGEILETGTCALYERLKSEVPDNIQRLLRLPGLTPRLVRILEAERGVCAPENLVLALSGPLDEIPSLNVNDRAQILRAVFSPLPGEDGHLG